MWFSGCYSLQLLQNRWPIEATNIGLHYIINILFLKDFPQSFGFWDLMEYFCTKFALAYILLVTAEEIIKDVLKWFS